MSFFMFVVVFLFTYLIFSSLWKPLPVKDNEQPLEQIMFEGEQSVVAYDLDEKKFIVGELTDLEDGKKYLIITTTDVDELDCEDITNLLKKAYDIGYGDK